MRDDDDHLRVYMPLLRRIIILVAVLTAVPVILWTITSFVHSYVGPPRAPNYRTASAPLPIVPAPDVTSTGSAQQDAAQPTPRSDPLPAMGEARAATMDTPAVAVPPNAAPMSDHVAGAPNAVAAPNMAAMPAPMPSGTAVPAMPAGAVAPAMPAVAIAVAPAAPAEEQPAATEQTADEMPAAEPIKGPIPLPRHRPHHLAMAEPAAAAAPPPSAATSEDGAQAGAHAAAAPASAAKPRVPLPRARPEPAGPADVATDTTNPNPIQWIQGLFQQHN